MAKKKRVSIIAAVAENGVIGLYGEIQWRLPHDLAHFKIVTTGGSVVMGRKPVRANLQLIGGPLPKR